MKIKRKYLAYIRPVIAILTLISGIALILVPFIPLGYLLILASIILFLPYIPFLRRIVLRIKKKDHRGYVDHVERKVDHVENEIYEKFSD